MSKATIIDEIIDLHRERGADVQEIATDAIEPVFRSLLALCGEQDKATELADTYTKRMHPVVIQAQRLAYDEMYSEPELHAMYCFLRDNPWFLERSGVQHKRVQALTAELGQPIIEELFRPFKYKMIKGNMLAAHENDSLSMEGLLIIMASYDVDDVVACYKELVEEGKLTVELINGVQHTKVSGFPSGKQPEACY